MFVAPAPKALERAPAVDPARRAATIDRLDRVANILIGATAATAGLLTALGVNNDRLFVLLDDQWAFERLLLAGLCSVVAVCAGLVAIGVGARSTDRAMAVQIAAIVIGLVFYLGGLGLTLVGVYGTASKAPGRPMVDAITLQPGEPGTVSFTVHAGRLDREHQVAVTVFHIDETPAYETLLRPDADGLVQHSVDLPLPRRATHVTVHVWRKDLDPTVDCVDSGFAVCTTMSVPVAG